jgi:hypothetical protein
LELDFAWHMMHFHSSLFRKVGVFSSALIIALAMVVVAGNFTASQSSGTSVTTCYNKKTGAMRYLVKGTCKKSETRLSVGQIGPQGPAGATGATGATGAAGGNGYSVGLSVYSPFADEETTQLDFVFGEMSPQELVFRSSDPLPVGGVANANRLILTSTKLVQVSANLMIYQFEGDPTVANLGRIACGLFRGNHGAPIDSFVEIDNSRAFLDISEWSANSYFIGSMAMTGFVTASTDSDFAIKCEKIGANPADTRVGVVTLNAVAIG